MRMLFDTCIVTDKTKSPNTSRDFGVLIITGKPVQLDLTRFDGFTRPKKPLESGKFVRNM